MAGIILGIDPGLASCGYGVLRAKKTGEQIVLASGCIKTGARENKMKRFKKIYETVVDLIDTHSVDMVVLEEVFYAQNVKTASLVNQVCGVIFAAAASHDVEVFLYTPLQIKQAISCYGRASKMQMQKMVQLILGLDTLPATDHEADALGAALCHINSTNYKVKV